MSNPNPLHDQDNVRVDDNPQAPISTIDELDRLAEATVIEKTVSDKMTPLQGGLLGENYTKGYGWTHRGTFDAWSFSTLSKTQASELINYSGGGYKNKLTSNWDMFETVCKEYGIPPECLTHIY